MRPAIIMFLTAFSSSGVALAQTSSASHTFAVSANVPGACAVGPPIQRPAAQVNFRGLSGSTLQIDQLVDSTTLSTNASSVEVSFPATCSFPHRLKVETQNNGLWQSGERGPQTPEGFGDAVPYRALLEWASEHLRLDADAQIRRIAQNSILVDASADGDIILRLEIDAGATNERANAPLLAGVYADTLRITLEPQ